MQVAANQALLLGCLQALLDAGNRQARAICIVGQSKALAQAQGVEHEFKGQFLARHLVALRHRLALAGVLHVKRRFTVPHLAQHPVRKTELAVRARPNAQIVAKLPIVQVVRAAVAGLGVGRHFVTGQPRSGGQLGDAVHHFVGQIVLGQNWWELGKHGVGLDGEVVDRDVRRCKAQRGQDILRQSGQRLARQGVHQVEVEGVKHLRRLGHGGQCLVTIMDPAQGFQVRIVKALHPDRQTVDARLGKRLETVFLESAGVGLHADLGRRGQTQAGADARDQALNRLG